MTVKTLDIDITLPADDVQPDKSEMRAKWSEIKSKYESLAGLALRFRGAWVSGSYLSGDVVTHLNGWWRASADVTTEVPGTAVEWVHVGTGAIIDEDNMATDSATRPPSQQSVKAYVDTNVANLNAAIDLINAVTHSSAFSTPTVTSNEMTLSAATDIALRESAGAIIDTTVRLVNDTPANALTVFLPNDAVAAKTKFFCKIPTSQTGAVTIKVAAGAGGTGTIDGVAGGTGILAPGPGEEFLIQCDSNGGDEPVYTSTIKEFNDTINFIIDGGGSAITTGVKGDVQVDFGCTIVSATALADQSGSIVVDIWKDTYANFPPTDADSITASAPVTISTATKSTDSTLTGWTTAISAGDILRYNVDSITTCERVTVALKVRR